MVGRFGQNLENLTAVRSQADIGAEDRQTAIEAGRLG
jgi:hypothetical protein